MGRGGSTAHLANCLKRKPIDDKVKNNRSGVQWWEVRLGERRTEEVNENMEKVSLQQLKQQYDGEWVAFLVVEETPNGDLLGQMIAHNHDRRELHRELRKKNVERAYVTFAGPVLKPGYTAILL